MFIGTGEMKYTPGMVWSDLGSFVFDTVEERRRSNLRTPSTLKDF